MAAIWIAFGTGLVIGLLLAVAILMGVAIFAMRKGIGI